jgi:hypothetical protein
MKKSLDVKFNNEKDMKSYNKFVSYNLYNEFKELR